MTIAPTHFETVGAEAQTLLDYIRDEYPASWRIIEANIGRNPHLFADIANRAVGWASSHFGPSYVQILGDGYAHFLTDVNREQLSYDKRGSYRNRSYDDVYKDVYDNDQYMQYYNWGVFATTFLWEHHLRIYQFFIEAFVNHLQPDGNVIELGSGSGIWSSLAASKTSGTTFTGIDISKSAVAVATSLSQAAGVDSRCTFKFGNALELVHEGERFNAGLSCFLMEHLEAPQMLIRKLAESVVPGGIIFLTAAITAAEVDHIYEFRSEGDVVAMLESNGLRVVKLLSATPQADVRRRFLPRSVAVLAQVKQTAEW
ncbi:MAG: class I SAM-dependent methyltransferase [Alphaproteobacteria bacterium]|nr:class I SAM-dependent methyltransferase [Alphaproteobacteria bacterium]